MSAVTAWLEEGDTDDWRAELRAARLPASPEQDVWDERWRPRFDRFVAGGKSPGEAARIAWRLSGDQNGPRPKTDKEAKL